jgi:hypothetical protein
MSYVLAAPEMIATAAADVVAVGSTLSAEHRAAAASTVALIPAGADEVSVSIAHLFSRYAEDYQGLAGKAAASQEQFVQNLKLSAVSYTSIEAAIASWLQSFNASADQLVHTITALPGEALSSLVWLLLPLALAVYPLDGEYLTMEFASNAAALPPRLAIPLLLTSPVSLPIIFFLWLASQP